MQRLSLCLVVEKHSIQRIFQTFVDWSEELGDIGNDIDTHIGITSTFYFVTMNLEIQLEIDIELRQGTAFTPLAMCLSPRFSKLLFLCQ